MLPMSCCATGLKIMLPKPEPAIAMPMTVPLFLMNQLLMRTPTVVVDTNAKPKPMNTPHT